MARTGTWELDRAILCRWKEDQLDQFFRNEWPNKTEERFPILWDEECSPSPPGPYCVLEKDALDIDHHSTGARLAIEEQRVVRRTFRFIVHAKNKNPETAKAICKRLACRIAEAFDPYRPLDMENDQYIQTLRGSDFPTREGDREWSWTLNYEAVWEGVSPMTLVSKGVPIVPGQVVVPPVTPPIIPPSFVEVDDVLDFADIGGVYDTSAAAAANRTKFLAYIATRAAAQQDVMLKFTGPVNSALGGKREPGNAYFDLAGGPMSFSVGGASNVQNLLLFGLGTIRGVNAASGTTPIFQITRTAGQPPNITLRDLKFVSDGSGLSMVTPGSNTRLENLQVQYTGVGTLNNNDWSDLDTASFGLKVDEADGLWVRGFDCNVGSGHGVIAKRWYAGGFQGNVRAQLGAGFKGQRIGVGDFVLRSESNQGYGLMVRNSGADRYTGGIAAALTGDTNRWYAWMEANNGRGTVHDFSGYRMSQFKMENCARLELHGHIGWRNNQARLDKLSRNRCKFIEEQRTDLTGSLTPAFQLVTNNLVDVTIGLPQDNIANPAITNFGSIWTNIAFRPSAAVVGAGTPADPQRVRITWPANSFSNTVVGNGAGGNVAYWRPWGAAPVSSPAAFYFEAEVKDVDGNIVTYCKARDDAASNKQTAIIGGFTIEPVSAGLMTFPLYDSQNRKFSGQGTVDDTRADISPAFNAWISGMQNQSSPGVPQSSQLRLDILQLRMWRLV